MPISAPRLNLTAGWGKVGGMVPLLAASTSGFSFGYILATALPVFGVTGLAFWLRWRGWWKAEGDSPLLWLMVHVLSPSLLFTLVCGKAQLMNPLAVLPPPVAGFALTVLGFAVGWYVARAMGLRIGAGLRTFAFATGIFNYGYMAIPLANGLFNDPETTGVLVIFNLGIEFALWTVGLMLVSGEVAKGLVAKIFNPPTVALVAALIANFTGLHAYIPAWVIGTLALFGQCAIPVGLMLAGAGLAEVARTGNWRSDVRVPLMGSILRLGLLPAAFLLVAWLLPAEWQDLRRVVVVQSAMPAGMFPIVLAKHYGGEPRVAVQIVIATTLGAILTMPIWIRIGLGIIGE